MNIHKLGRKSFITLGPVVDTKKLVSLPSKLECLSLAKHFQPSLVFLRKFKNQHQEWSASLLGEK